MYYMLDFFFIDAFEKYYVPKLYHNFSKVPTVGLAYYNKKQNININLLVAQTLDRVKFLLFQI